MKVVLVVSVLALVGLANCRIKRQCSCPNTRTFAAQTCSNIENFQDLFTLTGAGGNTLNSFGSILDDIAGRSDSQTVTNELCMSQDCFARLETMYSCCMVTSSTEDELTNNFSGVARSFVCNRPTSSDDYCISSVSDALAIMTSCSADRCNSACPTLLRRSTCCVISYFELLTNETQKQILTQDIWRVCSVGSPGKCENTLCFSPVFTMIGRDATVGNGDVHTITCRADGEDRIEYELVKEETEVFGFQLLDSFNLEDVRGTDGGRYRCIARNLCDTIQSDYFTLYVEPRMFITSNGNTTIFDNESISLQCEGDGYPQPTIQWIFDDTVIEYSGQLIISNLTINDSGIYSCMGNSTVGSAIESINITVLPAPIPVIPTTTIQPIVTSTYAMTAAPSITIVDITTTLVYTTSTTTVMDITPTFRVNGTSSSDDSEDALIIVLAIALPLCCVLLLLFIITCLLIELYRRKRRARKEHKKEPLLRNEPLSMATLKDDNENLLASLDPHPKSIGLVGISEAVEVEEGSTHDHDSAGSEKEEQKAEAEETKPAEQEAISKPSDVTEKQPFQLKDPKGRSNSVQPPLEFKAPKRRSNSVAERAKMFEQRAASPPAPLRSPRKEKIVLPGSEEVAKVPEGQLVELLQDPTIPPPPTEEPPPPPTEDLLPPESLPPLTSPESPPPLESPLLEPFSPGSDQPEPPLLEASQLESPAVQAADIPRASTMPADEKKKVMKKASSKKRSATVIKVSLKSNPLTPDALNQVLQNAAAAAAAEEGDANKIENLLAKEFHSIPMNFPRQEDLPKGAAVKDRYANVKPNAHSRVNLQSTGDLLSTYINANHIKGVDGKTNSYIATQGPTDASMDDFWWMIWEKDVSVIVMLTGLVENGKLKCHRYWPECYGEDSIQYGSIVVINNLEEKGQGYITTYLTIYQDDNPTKQREVTHFWFTAWPDFGVPDTTEQILSLRKRAQGQRGTSTAPIVVHCSAGVGRTGVFCAVDMGIQQYDREGLVDPYRYLSQMRHDRGGMIQKTKQYEFVCQALLDYVRSNPKT